MERRNFLRLLAAAPAVGLVARSGLLVPEEERRELIVPEATDVALIERIPMDAGQRDGPAMLRFNIGPNGLLHWAAPPSGAVYVIDGLTFENRGDAPVTMTVRTHRLR